MSIIIEESGMKFGEYSENQVFQIEKSPQYITRLRDHGIKSCEFILLRKDKLFFIEAKSSCPRHPSEVGSWQDQFQRYHNFINEISDKIRDSLLLYANILLNRYSQDAVPGSLLQAGLDKIDIQPIIVINPHDGNWKPEPELQDAIRSKLQRDMRIWKIKNILVINADDARKYKLIL